jgi:hypothetical protein
MAGKKCVLTKQTIESLLYAFPCNVRCPLTEREGTFGMCVDH